MQKKNRYSAYRLTMTAVMTAVTCILAPFSISIGPIPISFTNLAFYFALYLLGWKSATVSYLVYVLIGLVGLPVFSGFSGGLGKLMGPTGGYIVGFLPMAVIAGIGIDRCSKRWLQLLSMLAGTLVCYTFGTAWYCMQTGSALMSALILCVFPFIPGDLIKMAAAMSIGPVIKKRLRRTAQGSA